MYRIISDINENTKLAQKDNTVYVLKRIALGDVEIIKKLMKLECQYVVRFLGMCEIEGVFYAVEEYIQGVTLTEYIRQNGALDEELTSRISLALCEALTQIHALGIVHRDINPNNIMIDNYGVVKVIDFGISRFNVPDKTSDTQILGTAGYAAPEQFGFSQTSAKSDIYSLGVVINYMLTLKLPNEGLTKSYFAPIVLKCCEIDENNRYSSAAEVAEDIQKKKKRIRLNQFFIGFRQGVGWHKWVAGVYYSLIALFCIAIAGIDNTLKYKACFLGAFFFSVIIPVLIAFDFLNYRERIPFFRHRKGSGWGFKAFFIAVSIIIALVLILLSPEK